MVDRVVMQKYNALPKVQSRLPVGGLSGSSLSAGKMNEPASTTMIANESPSINLEHDTD